MTYKQNLHTHTTYVYRKGTLEEIICKAIDKEFNSIGFFEHSHLKYSLFSNRITVPKMLSYQDEIRSLKQKYVNVIDVFCGLEYDFYSNIVTNALDYTIGSVHYFCKADELLIEAEFPSKWILTYDDVKEVRI